MPQPTDLIFPKWQRQLFKTILDEKNLRFDREVDPVLPYSLRHTYICLRLTEGADIYQIAKNCCSVENDKKILCRAHQDPDRRRRDQRDAFSQVQEQNGKPSPSETPGFAADFGSTRPAWKFGRTCRITAHALRGATPLHYI